MTKKAVLLIAGAILSVGTVATIGLATVSRESSIQRDAAVEAKPKQLPLVEMKPARSEDVALRQAAVDKSPADGAKWRALGTAQLSTGDWDTAAVSLKTAVKVDPGNAAGWSALGEAYVHAVPSATPRMPELARQAFDKALSLEPGNVRARFYIALEKDYSGRHDDAINDWLALLKEVPSGSAPEFAIREAILASLNRNVRLVAKAVQDAQRSAVRQPPKNPAPKI